MYKVKMPKMFRLNGFSRFQKNCTCFLCALLCFSTLHNLCVLIFNQKVLQLGGSTFRTVCSRTCPYGTPLCSGPVVLCALELCILSNSALKDHPGPRPLMWNSQIFAGGRVGGGDCTFIFFKSFMVDKHSFFIVGKITFPPFFISIDCIKLQLL